MPVLHRLRQDDMPMRRLIRKLLDLQLDGGRACVLENPRRSRLWEMDEFRDLGDFPGMAECIVDSGAYGGTTVDGEPIVKPFKFLTNIPGAAARLDKRLSETQRMYTVPVQGKNTKPSQVYPQKLVEALLYLYHDYIRNKGVTRLPLHQALATFQSPVSDLGAWDPIVTMLERSFGTSSTRPFYVDVDSDVGKNIGDLLRMNLTRIQCVQTPTQRRLLLDFPFTVRSAFLLYADGARSVEMEDLSEIQQPSPTQCGMPFLHMVRVGERRPEAQPSKVEGKPDSPMPDLPTDVTFPGLSTDVPVEVRRAVARVHINLGHPTAEELVRLACHQGNPSTHFISAIRKLKCATCDRLKSPQAPPPAATMSTVTQFGDQVELDIFYVRKLDGENVMVLGIVDVATRFHQAAVLSGRAPEIAYEAFERVWLRPFGLPVLVAADPDGCFQGDFQNRLESHGTLVEHCPPDAHWKIAHVERQNAFLRTILEELVDTFSATSASEMDLLIAPSLHAANSMVLSRGRSAFQAVFGKVPRLPGGLFMDNQALAVSPMTDLAATAERVRSEAVKAIADMNVQQSIRRAILRKTRHLRIPDLEPGSPCCFWRWRRRGQKKRGGWVTAKFLSWDLSAPTKLAWVRSGTTTALVATEQLRSAVGFEQWVPTEQDVNVLKDASKALTESLWTDESGPAPAEEEMLEAQPLHRVLGEDDFLMDYQSNSELLAAASSQPAGQLRLDAAASWSPGTPVPSPEPPRAQLSGTVNNSYVYARLGDVGQGARRGNSMPRTPRRSRSPAPLTTMSTPRPALPPGIPELPQLQEAQAPALESAERLPELLSPEFSAPFEELPGLPEPPQLQEGHAQTTTPGQAADFTQDVDAAPADELPEDVHDYGPSPFVTCPKRQSGPLWSNHLLRQILGRRLQHQLRQLPGHRQPQ